MPNVIIRPDWHLAESSVTPERAYRDRRSFLRAGLERFLAIESPALTSVKRAFGWFYAPDGRPLNRMVGNVDTAQSEPVLQVAHAYEQACDWKDQRPMI